MSLYTFKLRIEKEQSQLWLLHGEKVIASREWPEKREMGRQLFTALSELLSQYGLQPAQISNFVIEGTAPETYTSVRIAETVKRVYAFGVTFAHHNQGG